MKLLMKTVLLSLIAVFLLSFASSCVHKYYIPNGHNVPVFQQKNEARISAALSDDGERITGQELQVSYAATNKIGLLASAQRVNAPKGNGSYFEGGAGYYKSLNNHFVFELYGVIGNGYAYNDFGEGRFISNQLFKTYIQPSLAYTDRVFDIAISSRFVSLRPHHINVWQVTDKNSFNFSDRLEEDYMQLQSNRNTFLIEPAFTLRAGYKSVKLQAQLSSAFFVGEQYFNISGLNANIGMFVSLFNSPYRPAYKKMENYGYED
jgi:hypothetical protein